MKNSNNNIRNRTRDLLVCSVVPQLTVPRVPVILHVDVKIYKDTYNGNDIDIMASLMVTSSWLKFVDMLLCILCVATSIHTFLYKFSKQRDQVPVSCVLWAQGPDPSELKTSILDVCVHM
jgi:hypothetical protein